MRDPLSPTESDELYRVKGCGVAFDRASHYPHLLAAEHVRNCPLCMRLLIAARDTQVEAKRPKNRIGKSPELVIDDA